MYRCLSFPSFFTNRPLLNGLDYNTLSALHGGLCRKIRGVVSKVVMIKLAYVPVAL